MNLETTIKTQEPSLLQSDHYLRFWIDPIFLVDICQKGKHTDIKNHAVKTKREIQKMKFRHQNVATFLLLLAAATTTSAFHHSHIATRQLGGLNKIVSSSPYNKNDGLSHQRLIKKFRMSEASAADTPQKKGFLQKVCQRLSYLKK